MKGEGNVTSLVLTPFTLNTHDVYIVNNHCVELKAKAPPSIWLGMFWIGMVTDGILGHTAYIKLWHHVNVLLIR